MRLSANMLPRHGLKVLFWGPFEKFSRPPGTPKDRVDILRDAFRKAFKDQEFHRDFLKLVGEDLEPLMPEELAKVVRDVPRNVEVTDLLKALSGAGLLPPR
jgi:tripartite-type tricarboxylate transporter receptor subunit TctC